MTCVFVYKKCGTPGCFKVDPCSNGSVLLTTTFVKTTSKNMAFQSQLDDDPILPWTKVWSTWTSWLLLHTSIPSAFGPERSMNQIVLKGNEWCLALISTQENIKKGWFWWQNVRYPLFHSFTWSTFFNLILFEENWKRFAWLYKCFTQWFFSGSVENATGGVWGWEVFVEKPCGIVIL